MDAIVSVLLQAGLCGSMDTIVSVWLQAGL